MPIAAATDLGLTAAIAVDEGQPIPDQRVQFALSATTRRIGSVVRRSLDLARPSPDDLTVELRSPATGVHLIPTGGGWDLELDTRATALAGPLTVKLVASSAQQGRRALLKMRVEVLARTDMRILVPTHGGRFPLLDRQIEFDPLPAPHHGSAAPQPVVVQYAPLPRSAGGIMLRAVPLTPTGHARAAKTGERFARAVRLLSGNTGLAASRTEAGSLLAELDGTVPYTGTDSNILARVWADYTAPYIGQGIHRLPQADVDSIDYTSGQLTSLVSMGWSKKQWAGVTPVLFVHGFNLFAPALSGGKSYWGSFPDLVRLHTRPGAGRFAPFEYRWNSDTAFTVQGVELAQAINTIYDQTGRKPVVVAHSFGGLLVRAVLQGQSGPVSTLARERVAAALTLGTPHSGIAPKANLYYNVALPVGAQSQFIKLCTQVSCHVAGQQVFSSGDSELERLGLQAEPGVDVALLSTTRERLPGIQFSIGVGVVFEEDPVTLKSYYLNGDGLITIMGQRLFPNEVKGAFRAWSSIPNSLVAVKETALAHFEGPYIVRRGREINRANLVMDDPYVSNGYLHGSFVRDLYDGGLEANPEGTRLCDLPGTCQHASWRLLKEILGTGSPLNDTGQTTCVNPITFAVIPCAGSAQDGESGRDVAANYSGDGKAGFSYVKISASGVELPASATTWSCVKDKVSGLMWEVKTDDGGVRDKDNRYTNWGDGRAGDASAFVRLVNVAGLCGYKDWRLPSPMELQGLVDYGEAYFSIDSAWFPDVIGCSYWNGCWYWTGSGTAYDSFRAWMVRFESGAVDTYGRGGDYHPLAVRLVRAIQ